MKENLELPLQDNTNFVYLFTGSKKVFYVITSITYLLFLIYAVRNYYSGYYLVALSQLIFAVSASVATINFHLKQKFTIHLNILVSLLLLSQFLSIYYLGINTAYWLYPVTIALIYILPKYPSLIFNSIILIYVSIFSFLQLPTIDAVRMSLALFLTIFFSRLIVEHIESLHQNLINESIRDPLTGALNRRQLTSFLTNCINQQKRHNKNSIIIMLDIDFFKKINDNFGHDIGDLVIQGITKVINDNCRNTDTLFRVGGEEFILLMQDVDISTAKKVAEKLRVKIKQAKLINNHTVTVSIGIASLKQEMSPDSWFKYADIALYQAKRSGRDQVQSYKCSNQA